MLFAVVPVDARGDDGAARDKVKAIEQHLKQVIDAAEPGVVAVVVSHKKYPPLPASDRLPQGRLGRYPVADVVRQVRPLGFPGGAGFSGIDPKLDLSDPQNIPDNQFGSGVVLDDRNGLVLTAYHLIESATKIYVRSSSGRGSYADIFAADARSDLAVLKLIDPVPGLRAIKMAAVRLTPGPNGEKPSVARGMWVISLGHPQAAGFADGTPSASWGILSNVRRRAGAERTPGPFGDAQADRALYQYGSLLQTDARVTIGCSGAALLNFDGELVGLTTPMAAVTGIETAGGFAIPMDTNYRRIIGVLAEGKEVEYGFLGVSVGLANTARFDRGLPISSVSPGTPAARAGLTAADLIIGIDGNPVREQDDLFLHVGAALAGTKVRLTVVRDGQSRAVDVVLTKFLHKMARIVSTNPPSIYGLRVDYSSVLLMQLIKAQDPQARDVILPPGVMIRDLEAGSPAERRLTPLGDIKNQWLVTRVNNVPVATPAEFYGEALPAAAGKAPLKLTLVDIKPGDAPSEREVVLP
ncbi:S1C family serine protease [Fimbriiglobus ruber]|uniref:Serine protease, DegP/HtrA, do-like n=1 Tax=Fimbriiglobus ruber TaxID=1908690 RepID=A0A225E2Q0_9BACT|nr:trypsin-like peptidase domain-containing protein [Fimbriiglobus ruber]OWK44356.1 Serine protease, DegP/HtrA, do-like [Fimbriiglobus ruber]